MKDQEGNVKQWSVRVVPRMSRHVLTISRESGRTLLIEDHKVKRENEVAHRAAL